MSIKRFDAKRDANEPEIIDILEKHGLMVYRLDQPLDLLVGYKDRNYLVEVKTENGTLTQLQKDFIVDWKGQYKIINSVENAIVFANAVRSAGCIR